MHGSGVRIEFQSALAPESDDPLRELVYRDCIFLARSKIPRLRVFLAVFEQAMREKQISAQWLEDMLPGTNRIGPANHHWFSRSDAAHNIRHEAILRPVAAANHVPCPRRGNCRTAVLGEK